MIPYIAIARTLFVLADIAGRTANVMSDRGISRDLTKVRNLKIRAKRRKPLRIRASDKPTLEK